MEAWPPAGGFAESVLQRGRYVHPSELRSEMSTLTGEHLDYFTIGLLHLAKLTNRKVEIDHMEWSLAVQILRFFSGEDWVDDNLFPVHTDVSREHREGRVFLNVEAMLEDRKANFRHIQRV